ncbi:hypothetical protein T484DRAFT_1803861 [Baffinella frigidus]|nr:hypothetical protein T484DRAFT_1803861 [Cryptophyta sp. CCMP2293]
MQANGGGEVRDREREGDSRVGGEGEEAGEDEAPARKVNDLQNSTNNFNFTKENAALASSRTEAWERLDQPMQEAATVGEESDGENLPALLASLGLRSGKFADGQYGNLELFDTGLEGYVGLPDVHVFQAMMREHASTEKFTPDKEEWEHIVTKGPDGNVVVNASDRSGKSMCQDFMEHEMTKKAGLTLEEVIALRLYTGPQFQKYNQHLRGLNAARTEKVGSRSLARSLSRSFAKRAKTERHYTTTIHAIASALKKVARVTKLPEGGKVYRGMSGVRLPEAFREPDEYGCRGGVELGFLSTSTSKEQALKYIDMRKCMPTLFEIQLGQVDRGATLRWISQFPGEEEVLLPPLSNLEVVGEPVTIIREGVEVNVCQLRVNVNLKAHPKP